MALLKHKDWLAIDGDICRATQFTPRAKVKNGKVVSPGVSTPYASLVLENPKFEQGTTAFITHKVDFLHLWTAFLDVGVKDDEEVLISWNKKQETVLQFVARIMPKLWVAICRRGAYELSTDPNSRPELDELERLFAQKPIIDWLPPNLGEPMVSDDERRVVLLERRRG